MTQHFISRNNVGLAYGLAGEGPLVVLVQGLGLSGRLWLDLPQALARHGSTVVTPDTRGTGRSSDGFPPYTMPGLARDLAAVIEHVDRGPALVVGLSLGGMIAQQLTLNRPELVRGLVIASSSCGMPHGRIPNLHFMTVLTRALFGDPFAIKRLPTFLVHRASLERDPRLLDEGQRLFAKAPLRIKGITGQLTAAAMHSTGFSLHHIGCPTVVIAGEEDRIIPADNSRIIARRIPGAELTILPDAGHVFPLEHPKALGRAIKRVQQRIDAATAAA